MDSYTSLFLPRASFFNLNQLPLPYPSSSSQPAAMPAAVDCSVKCRPHHRLMTPQLPAALELLPLGAPAFADELEATRCRTLLSLSFARASDQG
ncbi:putative GTP diphosphokinase RSH3, chloroplastic [Hordeum vulgare]|nr:putative GTP diphosphokinase RSH3, chloroplastic [Hordeum vulgare]